MQSKSELDLTYKFTPNNKLELNKVTKRNFDADDRSYQISIIEDKQKKNRLIKKIHNFCDLLVQAITMNDPKKTDKHKALQNIHQLVNMNCIERKAKWKTNLKSVNEWQEMVTQIINNYCAIIEDCCPRTFTKTKNRLEKKVKNKDFSLKDSEKKLKNIYKALCKICSFTLVKPNEITSSEMLLTSIKERQKNIEDECSLLKNSIDKFVIESSNMLLSTQDEQHKKINIELIYNACKILDKEINRSKSTQNINKDPKLLLKIIEKIKKLMYKRLDLLMSKLNEVIIWSDDVLKWNNEVLDMTSKGLKWREKNNFRPYMNLLEDFDDYLKINWNTNTSTKEEANQNNSESHTNSTNSQSETSSIHSVYSNDSGYQESCSLSDSNYADSDTNSIHSECSNDSGYQEST
ncbi:hypothetical protein [Candidatus Cardinium hertigii]|uniref:hypothetical protein n=2 Tax=Candidatus Cardinium TaxID=273135 RepID=UPI001FAA94E2|nr:hypothetical protein [Candidatus Cardinium hertigii]